MLKLVCLEFSNSFQFISHFPLSLLLPFSHSHPISLYLLSLSLSLPHPSLRVSHQPWLPVPCHHRAEGQGLCRWAQPLLSPCCTSLPSSPSLSAALHITPFTRLLFSSTIFQSNPQSTFKSMFKLSPPDPISAWPLAAACNALCFRGRWVCPLPLALHIRDTHILHRLNPRLNPEVGRPVATGGQIHRVLGAVNTACNWCVCWEGAEQHCHRCRVKEWILQLCVAGRLEKPLLGARKHQERAPSFLPLFGLWGKEIRLHSPMPDTSGLRYPLQRYVLHRFQPKAPCQEQVMGIANGNISTLLCLWRSFFPQL